PFMVDFRFLEEGIRVGGQRYPVLKMRWVEGLTVNTFVRDHVEKPPVLERLAQLWVRLSQQLRGAGMAHGDLQHGNVLLVARAPAASPLFQDLWRMSDPTVHMLVGHLALASQRRLSFVPLLDELAANDQLTPLSAQEAGVVAKLLATGGPRVHPVTRLAAASIS